jgi:hypothetical protein
VSVRFVSRHAAMLCALMLSGIAIAACRDDGGQEIATLAETPSGTEEYPTSTPTDATAEPIDPLIITDEPTNFSAELTPTVTPMYAPAERLIEVNGVIVYERGENLCLAIDETHSIFLAEMSGIFTRFTISPDGEVVVFTNKKWITELEVAIDEIWAIDSDGQNRRLLMTTEQAYRKFPEIMEYADIYDMAWIPGTHILAFNTGSLEAGGANYKDLHILNIDTGEYSNPLPPYDMLSFPAYSQVALYPSPDGRQIALVGPDSISLINVDGTDYRAQVLRFSLIALPHFPLMIQPTWTADSRGLWVAVPPSNDATELKTWYLPVDGQAVQYGSIDFGPLDVHGMALVEQAVASPTGEYLAYVENSPLHITSLDGTTEVFLHDGDGYSSRFIEWIDATHFTFSNLVSVPQAQVKSFKYIGEVGGGYQMLPEPPLPAIGCTP